MTRPELIIFDVNETLSDLSPMSGHFEAVGLPGHEATAWFAGLLRDGFGQTAAGGRPDFAELAKGSLRVRLGGDEEKVQHVMEGFLGLQTHADVAPGIRALRGAGIRLVTLSNGSASVAEGLLGRAGVADQLEALLSVNDAPAWKPDRRAYAYALDATGVDAGEAMLVASHPWDIDGAARAGLRTAWIDRSGTDYPGYASAPEVVASDLGDLARRLG
jgi:2-haloacid dehalogenase